MCQHWSTDGVGGRRNATVAGCADSTTNDDAGDVLRVEVRPPRPFHPPPPPPFLIRKREKWTGLRRRRVAA